MIRIGILGAARIAPRGIVTPANETLGAEVTAIASRDLDRARDFASQHSIPMAFGSYAELISRDDIDLVYCALPPSAKKDVDINLLAAVPGTYEAPASSTYLYYTAEDKAWAKPVAITIAK